MILHSIRFRLQIWHGLILLAVLTGFGAMAHRMAWDDELRAVDRELEQRAAMLFRPMGPRPGPPGERPPGGLMPPPPFARREGQARLIQSIEEASGGPYYFVFFDTDGSVLKSTAQEPIPMPETLAATRAHGPFPAMAGAARTRGTNRESYRVLPFGDMMLVGRSIAPELSEMRAFAFSLAAGGGALLVIGLVGGWVLASRAMRPIGAISATASRIAGGDLSQRIPAAQTEDELADLASVLNSTFERLEESFQRQARFTADASHELRTPVTVMLSQLQMSLARERSAAEYRETLLACQRAAQRMRKLAESLLALTRLEAGEEKIRHDRFELSQVAEESVELVRARADERGVALRCDLDPAECTGDADRVAQVVTNLLDNAIRYTPKGGEVRVATARNGRGAKLIVSDNGEGIPAEALPHVFERFYRADKARAITNGGGAGLGLAICQAIVQAHGGSIGVKSELGQGSEFTVTLPDQ